MKKIVGIMGPNNASANNLLDAYEIGKYLAKNNYVVLTGGLNIGATASVNYIVGDRPT